VAVGRAGKISVFRLLENDDLIEAIKKKAEESNIKAGAFILIGSIKQAVLGYYKDGEYKNTLLEGPLEVASCMGNVALDEKGEVVVHAHVVVTNEKSEAFGGHLMKDSPVGATAELVIIEATEINMQRIFDEKTKLKLLKLT
jgi:predicted DNA-binding protein with PD1-like motif